jgi:hypothetical protein
MLIHGFYDLGELLISIEKISCQIFFLICLCRHYTNLFQEVVSNVFADYYNLIGSYLSEVSTANKKEASTDEGCACFYALANCYGWPLPPAAP